MNDFGQDLFAGTRGAHQERRHIGLCNSLSQGEQMLADGVDKHIALHLGICGRQAFDSLSPSLGVPFITGQHVKCT